MQGNHITYSSILYSCAVAADSIATVHGINADTLNEGNPLIRYAMNKFGIISGLLLSKVFVFGIILIMATIVCRKYRADKQYISIPIYSVGIAQILASLWWLIY